MLLPQRRRNAPRLRLGGIVLVVVAGRIAAALLCSRPRARRGRSRLARGTTARLRGSRAVQARRRRGRTPGAHHAAPRARACGSARGAARGAADLAFGSVGSGCRWRDAARAAGGDMGWICCIRDTRARTCQRETRQIIGWASPSGRICSGRGVRTHTGQRGGICGPCGAGGGNPDRVAACGRRLVRPGVNRWDSEAYPDPPRTRAACIPARVPLPPRVLPQCRDSLHVPSLPVIRWPVPWDSSAATVSQRGQRWQRPDLQYPTAQRYSPLEKLPKYFYVSL